MGTPSKTTVSILKNGVQDIFSPGHNGLSDYVILIQRHWKHYYIGPEQLFASKKKGKETPVLEERWRKEYSCTD